MKEIRFFFPINKNANRISFVKYRILALTVPVVIALDQWTKHLILAHFRLGQSRPVISGLFNLTYVRNFGAAFSFLNDAPQWFRGPFFIVVPTIILSVLTYLFIKLTAGRNAVAFAYSLIAGGAFGNIIDRLRFGYVVDFLHFYWGVHYWPMFNVADSCIVVGVGILLIDSFRTPAESNAG